MLDDRSFLTFALLALAAVAAVLALHAATAWVLRRLLHDRPLAVAFVRRLRGPVRLGLVVATVRACLEAIELEPAARSGVGIAVRAAAAVTIGWLVSRSIRAVTDEAVRRIDVDQADNLRARTLQTQLVVARRAIGVVIVVIVTVMVARSFDDLRGLGATLLASAGLVGVVAGVAGRSTIGNLVAGVQIAVAAPIRLDDVVVVEGEFGRVEEITLTYVVVRLWDQRRLVLPCLHFVEHPFENWTHRTSDLLGSVVLQLDHRLDVDALRTELHRVVLAHPGWDGRVANVQVVDTTPTTMTVRVLLSSRDASSAWDLRCDVRERVLAWLREHQPDALPRVRVEAPLSVAA